MNQNTGNFFQENVSWMMSVERRLFRSGLNVLVNLDVNIQTPGLLYPLCPMNHSGFGLNQWKTTLHCSIVFHWLSPYPEWSRCRHQSGTEDFKLADIWSNTMAIRGGICIYWLDLHPFRQKTNINVIKWYLFLHQLLSGSKSRCMTLNH